MSDFATKPWLAPVILFGLLLFPACPPPADVAPGDDGGGGDSSIDAGTDAGDFGDAGPSDGGPLDAGTDAGPSPDAGPPPANAAEFVTEDIPVTATAGRDLFASVTLRNTGTATWTSATGYCLGSEHPMDNLVWGTNRMFLGASDSVAPGQTFTFAGTLKAPADAGTYPMQWQMLQDAVEWFGAKSTLASVTVECPATELHLKAHLGQYVTADPDAGPTLAATAASVGPWETFQLLDCQGRPHGGDTVVIKTHDGHYLTAVDGGGGPALATASAAGPNETFTLIRVAGPGPVYSGTEVALQSAGGDYLCAESGGGDVVNANRTSIGPWETFNIELAGGGPPRTGPVSRNGTLLHDDTGDFDALGATLFSAANWYKFDRPRLERALGFLRDNGFDYFRALGTVAWTGKEIDPAWPDYADVLAGVTDLAYDSYGLRVQWTIFGDAQLIAPTPTQRQQVVDTVLQMSAGREQKIILIETANEYWQNGFDGAGVAELRTLTQYLHDNTSILVAASAPTDWNDQVTVYQGGIADVMTQHFDRASFAPDYLWRPVRQPWGALNDLAGDLLIANNEPIGPGSSVVDDKDPLRLVMAAVTTYVSKAPFYVFHSRAGVGAGSQFGLSGDQDFSEMPGAASYQPMKAYLPADLSNWDRQNHYWAGHPFRVYGDGTQDFMTTDGAVNGCMRAYASTRGPDFLVALLGIKGTLHLEAKAPMEFDELDPLTGGVLQHFDIAADAPVDLSGLEGLVLKGHNK